MDFETFNTRSASDEGRPLHVSHPVTGQPLFDNPEDPFGDNGLPCLAYVRGTEGRDTQRAVSKVLQEIREAEEEQGEDDKSGKSRESLHHELVKLATPLVAGFKNIKRGDKPATEDDAEWFLNLQMSRGMEFESTERSFAEQVAQYSANRSNYLGNGPSGC